MKTPISMLHLSVTVTRCYAATTVPCVLRVARRKL
jgi:hypothetical protein